MNSSEQQQLQNCFFNPSWDQNDLFDSALSSIVSSPVAATAGEGVMLRELIGRLGTIRDSSQISPESYANLAGEQSTPFSADPGFAERAARYSCFAAMKIDPVKVSGSQSSSPEGSSVSEQISAGVRAQSIGNGRKRKPKSAGKDSKVASEDEGSKAKKSKQEDKAKEEASEIEKKGGEKKQKENNSEPPKDYIHVRARRGQATDSHSLAERVRREKISERMKFLQDLVPGCNKVTGKAVMLDEIINYVQSLQRQVEFLSMKLSTVNPRMDFNMEALLSKETLQSLGSLQQGMYPMDSSAPAFPYGYGSGMPLPPFDGFGDVAAPPQVSGFWEEDLQGLVQVGFCPNQAQDFQGQMKVEL